MKIAQVREILDRSAWMRNDLSGHTREEFKRADVRKRIDEMLLALLALDIASRYTKDVLRRNHEINCCRTVLARWEELHGTAPAADARPPSGLLDMHAEALSLTARRAGEGCARRLFAKRGDNKEVHLSEYELALLCAAAAQVALSTRNGNEDARNTAEALQS